jgi:hypothetical protein
MVPLDSLWGRALATGRRLKSQSQGEAKKRSFNGIC